MFLAIGLYAIVAFKNLLQPKNTNTAGGEVTIPAHLKFMHKAQEMFLKSVSLDRNENGAGEYADNFLQLQGIGKDLTASAQGVRNMTIDTDESFPARAERQGYYFQLFTSIDAGERESSLDEKSYAIVSWPMRFNSTSGTCFAVDETGTIYRFANENGRFNGPNKPVLLTDLYGTPFDPTTIGQGGAAFTSAK